MLKLLKIVRQEFNHIQFELIKSHVTLCREDEIQNLDQILTNLAFSKQTEISIEFGNLQGLIMEKDFFFLQQLQFRVSKITLSSFE